MTQAAIQDAFARTAAHPADAGVRIARTPEDLAAIQTPGVKAVIWEREMPQDIADDLDRVRGASMRQILKVFSAASIRRDNALLNEVFASAIGSMPNRNVSIDKPYNMPSYEDLHLNSGQRVVMGPHIDMDFHARMGCVYSPAADYGTEWYPGAQGWNEMHGIKQLAQQGVQLDASGLQSIKDRCDIQTVRAGSVMLFKGSLCGAEALPHSGPAPRAGVPRLGLLKGLS